MPARAGSPVEQRNKSSAKQRVRPSAPEGVNVLQRRAQSSRGAGDECDPSRQMRSSLLQPLDRCAGRMLPFNSRVRLSLSATLLATFPGSSCLEMTARPRTLPYTAPSTDITASESSDSAWCRQLGSPAPRSPEKLQIWESAESAEDVKLTAPRLKMVATNRGGSPVPSESLLLLRLSDAPPVSSVGSSLAAANCCSYVCVRSRSAVATGCPARDRLR